MKITIKEMLTFVPIGAFVAGYSYLFGLLYPLGLEALSTLTYVDVIEAAIANIVFILIISFVLFSFTNGQEESIENLKDPKIIAFSVLLLLASILSYFFFETTIFLFAFFFAALSMTTNLIFSKLENRLGVSVVVITIMMSMLLGYAGGIRLESIDKESDPKIVLKNPQDDDLLLVFSLDRNVLAYSAEDENYKLIPHDQVSHLEFRK